MDKKAANWIATSKYDLITAQKMYETGRYIYAVFMLHLCLEKMLKAMVVKRTRKEAPKTHDLIYLIKLTKIELPGELLDFTAKMNNASIVTRYPEDLKAILHMYRRGLP